MINRVVKTGLEPYRWLRCMCAGSFRRMPRQAATAVARIASIPRFVQSPGGGFLVAGEKGVGASAPRSHAFQHEKTPLVWRGSFSERPIILGRYKVELEGLCRKTGATALPLALHRLAFLAGGGAVPVALEAFLGNPSDDGRRVLGAVELLHKLRFKCFDVTHWSFSLADKVRPLCVAASDAASALSECPSEVTG